MALALQAAVVGATNPSLRLTKGNDNCNTALARRGEGATGRNQCPEGTDIEDNKQGGNINPKVCACGESMAGWTHSWHGMHGAGSQCGGFVPACLGTSQHLLSCHLL